ncbi:hypothetical protein RCL_jg18357.t1 [Rhizophagus clarus]|uniref:Uncharacterized protein n=1 Tax=Rhizophagus clarus TaxID=94130 RepID=A0A8H3LGK5_9GLOM|nr:hypothetical protein RCL_jg18357.t1 [Rhizophagus clarus]
MTKHHNNKSGFGGMITALSRKKYALILSTVSSSPNCFTILFSTATNFNANFSNFDNNLSLKYVYCYEKNISAPSQIEDIDIKSRFHNTS